MYTRPFLVPRMSRHLPGPTVINHNGWLINADNEWSCVSGYPLSMSSSQWKRILFHCSLSDNDNVIWQKWMTQNVTLNIISQSWQDGDSLTYNGTRTGYQDNSRVWAHACSVKWYTDIENTLTVKVKVYALSASLEHGFRWRHNPWTSQPYLADTEMSRNSEEEGRISCIKSNAIDYSEIGSYSRPGEFFFWYSKLY